jgi:methylmalonyl-CoA carboxyltransferase large subunit
MASFIIALVTGVAAGAVTARAIVRRELERHRESTESQADAAKQVTAGAVVPPLHPAAAPAPVMEAPAREPEEITPEILTVLTAAVAAFLGKRAKIRSARALGGAERSSAWAQQGRVFVQASHNLPLHR